jgi:hypothetical protein
MPSQARHTDALLNGQDGRRSLLGHTALHVEVDAWDVSDHHAVDQCCAVFMAGVRRDELHHVEQRRFPRQGSKRLDGIELLGRVELSWCDRESHDAVLTLPEGPLVLLSVRDGFCEVVVAGGHPGPVTSACDRLEQILRDEGEPEKHSIPVSFWSDDPHGPLRRRKTIEAPDWADVQHNYGSPAREGLKQLMDAQTPGAGSLLLWHGPPGTGKSHALRAVARRWHEWCSTHYITDPENFLGAGTGYLMEVAVAHDERDSHGQPRWRLIVLEDAGELISSSARSQSGQALSRLLNVADGLLGQGGRSLLLITTNEPVGRLHPAVRRPGRCWAQVEFGALPVTDAAAWLARHGSDAPINRPTTLAELYAIVDGREPARPEHQQTFGFGVR